MIWDLQQDEALTGVGDEDLLGVDESAELEKVLWHRYFLLLKFYLKMMKMLLVRHRFSFFIGDLEGLCERPITLLSVESCFTKTPPSGIESFFLSLLLSSINWYKQ